MLYATSGRQAEAEKIRTTPLRQPDDPEAEAFRAIVLVGPTAVGKTAVAHQIARLTGDDVLCADSMSVYRGMDVGTAKPTTAMRHQVRYFGLDLIEPDRPFSVGQFYEYCRTLYREGKIRSDHLVVVGGSGLYIKALTHGLDPLPPASAALRRRAREIYEAGGVEGLLAELERVAPELIPSPRDERNPRRLMRALEIAWQGVRPPRSWHQAKTRGVVVGLDCPRQLLHQRIERRVDEMLERGLVEEVRTLRERYGRLSPTAASAIGYAEISDYLDGRLALEGARARMVSRTRQLAKRQMTWFRHQEKVVWVSVVPDDDPETTADRILRVLEKHGKAILAV